MSDSEEEREASYFGTPLEPYDEDAFPKKRPITVEEQVAKDAQGRRRFHGAFTGGFSAGFFNTVGSLEGWTPSEFKSSRSDKTQNKQQKPEDFMDDEDIGEFGIAPQTVRATDDYASSKKRKKKIFSDGPIPGEPVLETLLQAGNETVGYFLMKNMNQKHRSTTNDKPGPKVYGCVMPKDLPTDEAYNHPEYNLHEAYKQYLSAPKSNTFGLGYVGLDKTHISLFQPAKLMVRERNNKKLSISGQAFGVGAFEDDDEDIYVKDDMSRYDFEMTAESGNQGKKSTQKNESSVLDIFVLSKSTLVSKETFPLPVIPSSFSGKHNVRKSRFEPVMEETETLARKNIDAAVRAKYLGEDHGEKTYTPSNQQHKQPTEKKMDKNQTSNEKAKNSSLDSTKSEKNQSSFISGLLLDRFVSAKQDDDPTNILEAVKSTEITHGTKEMHAAVKLKMFGPLTRVTISWQPNSFLCKRFNVPEPHFQELNAQRNKKRTKNLIFEYQKHNENNLLPQPGLSVQIPDTSLPIQTTVEDTPSSNIVEQIPESNIDNQIVPEPSISKDQEVQNTEVEDTKQKTSSKKVLDITERVDVSKNTDLFKAVFLSSSESESENEAIEEDEETKRKEQMTANVLSEPLVPKIKSTKEGILSNIDFSKLRFSKSDTTDEQKIETEPRIEDLPVDDNIYGPKLPDKVSGVKTMPVSDTVVNNDEWVEKDSVEKQKKHKKKHKKEKDREKHRKKHKHKSKR